MKPFFIQPKQNNCDGMCMASRISVSRRPVFFHGTETPKFYITNFFIPFDFILKPSNFATLLQNLSKCVEFIPKQCSRDVAMWSSPQKPVPDCDCRKELLRMTLENGNHEIWDRCPGCCEHIKRLHPLAPTQTSIREEHFMADWLRRLADFQKADDEVLSIGPDYQIDTKVLVLASSGLTTWTDRTLPVDHQPNDSSPSAATFTPPR